LKGGDDMENLSDKLLFIDRFRPRLKGVELLVLSHLIKEMMLCNGLTSSSRSILEDIDLGFDSIIEKHNLPNPPGCFNIF
jgi:hypothetical protein